MSKMDTAHKSAIRRACCITIFYFILVHNNLADAMTLEFCQSSDHTATNSSETGVIKSPGLGTEVRNPDNVPSRCTIQINVCSGCRVTLTNTSTVDCVGTHSCFLKRAHVSLKGFPMKTVFFPMETIYFNASSALNVTSSGRSVELVFYKSPDDPVTGQFGFYLYYEVRRPKAIAYAFDPDRRTGTISSLGFPDRYESNGDAFRFHFEAAPTNNYLTLSFSDWYLSEYSKVTIQEGYKYSIYDYQSDRPTVIAIGQHILIIFETGMGDTSLNYIGFKATYNYTYGSPDDNKAVEVGTNVYDSVFGGSISFTHYGSDDVDYVWVIPRSDVIGPDVIGSDATKLKLRIETMTHLPTDALEIRSGPTSEAVAVDWTAGVSLFNEAGFYIRLRSSFGVGSRIAFYAVYAWTGKPKSGGSQCRYTDLVCQEPLECLKSRDLACDGIKHCDDGTDETGCTALSTPCQSYWTCRKLDQRPICITRKCDGVRDCLDSSDEINCQPSTICPFEVTTLYQWDVDRYSNYGTLSIALPLAMLGIIITIIVSFIACIAIRRKRHLSLIRRTLQNEAPSGALNTDRNAHYSAHFTPSSDVVSPPPYGEIVFHNNQGFTTLPGPIAPPPYEEVAKPLESVESSAPPPPYLQSEETTSMQPLRENRTSPHRSGEQRTSPRHSGEQRTSRCHSGEQRTSPRHSGELITGGSTAALISGNSEC